MTPQPIPCYHCGTLFMRRNITLDASKLCNTCEYKENLKLKNMKKEKIGMMKILIECTQAEHTEIESECTKKGMTYSEYFLSLHKDNVEPIEENSEQKMNEKKISKRK